MEWLAVHDLSQDEQVLLSVVLAIVTVGLIVVAPRLVKATRDRIDERSEIAIDDQRRPVRVGTVVAQRLVQGCMLLVAVVLLLLLWNQHLLLAESYGVLSEVFPHISRLVFTGVLVVGAYEANNTIGGWVDRTTNHASQFNEHDQEIIKRVLQLSLLIVLLLLILSIWSVDISGLLVGAGVLGIIIGYAARDTLGSIIAGMVLMLSRPIEIGDWIVTGDDRGIVTHITIVNTRIRSPNGEHIIIPNSKLANRTIRNRSHERRLRFSVDVGVDYDTDIERARAVALEAIETVDLVAEAPFPSVLVNHMDDSSIVLRIRFWVDRANTEKQWKAENQVLEAVTEAFSQEGIHIPYPHQRFVAGPKQSGR